MLTRITNHFLKKKFSFKKSAIASFYIVSIFILSITYFTMGILKGFIIYIPCLGFWLWRDINKAKNAGNDKGSIKL